MNDDARPWGTLDPNSEHQRWSRWVFGVEADRDKTPSVQEVVANGRVYFRKLFGTMGRVRCDQQGTYYAVVVEIEGPPVQDPEYCERVRGDFATRFMAKGFGPGARLTRFVPGLLAGDAQDGRPPAQLLVLPTLSARETLHQR